MTADIALFLATAAVIVMAGAVLTQCGDIIAKRTQLGGLLVGTILIAGATSLPELGVNIASVRRGDADLAAGDLLGSSLMNLLILAVLDLTRYSHGRMLSHASAQQALGATSRWDSFRAGDVRGMDGA
jgi:cation:H+ antiporter